MADTGTDARPPLLNAGSALYLDFDGTLAAFAPHPDGVTVNESLPGLLTGLRERLAGAVALVTGRSLATLDGFMGLGHFAGAGLHGLELRYPDGRIRRLGDPEAARPIARALRAHFEADPRIIVEDKGPTVALHYRRARERAEECIAAMREIVEDTGFEVMLGHAVVEARPRGMDKGLAYRALAAEAPFVGRKPVFIGDDATDEDGFRAVAQDGGFGVKVGLGATVAPYRIDAVGGVHDWLAASLAALSAEARA